VFNCPPFGRAGVKALRNGVPKWHPRRDPLRLG